MHVSRRWWQRTHPYFSKYEGKGKKINNGSALIHPIVIRRMRKISYIKCFSQEYTSATISLRMDPFTSQSQCQYQYRIPNIEWMKDSPLPSPLPTPPYSSLGVQFKSVYMCVDPSIHQFLCEQKKRPYMHINLYLRILYLLACTRVSIPCYPLPYIPFHLFCLRIIMQKRHILILTKKSVKGTYIPTRPCTCVLPT